MTQRCTKMDITYFLWSGGHGTILLWELGSAGTHTARMAIFGLLMHPAGAFLGLHFVRTCFIGDP